MPGKWDNKTENIIFSGLISIPYNAKIYAIIDEFNKFQVLKITPFEKVLEGNSSLFENKEINDLDYVQYNLLDTISFQKLQNDLIEITPSSKRLLFLKKSLTPQKVNTAAVKYLLKYLDFDQEKLEFSLYAYYFTVDRQNYHQLKYSFIFPGTAKELFDKTINLYK